MLAMEISNKTKRPLKVPLPGGKRLFLGPGATGQITAKALEHAPLKALLDAGEIEVVGGGRSQDTSGLGEGTGGKRPSQGGGGGSYRHVGDR